MIESEYKKLLAAGRIYFGKDNNSQPNVIRYLTEVEGMVPWTWWPHDEAGHNDEAKKEINLLFGAEDAFLTPKPERLLQRIINIATNSGDLVLDSFLGSGTTTAVAHKMGRRWIGIEMGEHARTHCLPRLKKVVEGEQGGISKSVGWKGGGGFRFMKLGAKAFFDDGALNADIRFKDLAAYLWFLETRIPHETGQFRSPLLGVHNGTAYVLLYNGIIADRRPESGNVLTTALWNGIRKLLPRDRRNTVIYGEASRFSASRLKDLKVIFKQIPYDISMR
jgi:adenine-specific DNA-methyltransferase